MGLICLYLEIPAIIQKRKDPELQPRLQLITAYVVIELQPFHELWQVSLVEQANLPANIYYIYNLLIKFSILILKI
jgi:hypothetical protein